jgi:hypothetical protein
MSRLSRLLLVFSIAFTVLIISPAFLGGEFGYYPLMKWGDVLDLFTPLILMPLYWLLFYYASERKPGIVESILFVILAALWVEGQGMHLSANSIGHLIEGQTSDLNTLTFFYDEVLSHYLWHLGVVGLAILLVARQWRYPLVEGKMSRGSRVLTILAGILHGFTLFAIFIEGGTALLGIPFTLIFAVVVLIWGWNKLKDQPLVLFYFVSCLVGFLFLAGWGLYWSECPPPQLCEKGFC